MAKKKTLQQEIISLAIAVAVAMTIRWALVEAYVIPSGSMLPSLLIHDHIFVNKIVYGVRVPFSKSWLAKFRIPSRGEVIIFRYPEDESIFFVKRVVGVPGDKISWNGEQLFINGEKVPTKENDRKDYFLSLLKDSELQWDRAAYRVTEEIPASGIDHPVLIKTDMPHKTADEITVPNDSLFVMGDNRDDSRDSRFWGFVPIDNLLGRAMFVWLSCEETLPVISFLCNPLTTRWQRFFHVVE